MVQIQPRTHVLVDNADHADHADHSGPTGQNNELDHSDHTRSGIDLNCLADHEL